MFLSKIWDKLQFVKVLKSTQQAPQYKEVIVFAFWYLGCSFKYPVEIFFGRHKEAKKNSSDRRLHILYSESAFK